MDLINQKKKTMEELIKRLERLKKRNSILFRIRHADMSFNETRIYLELTKTHLRRLIKARSVPYHNRYHKPRVFNKTEVNLWLVQVCLKPWNELEKGTGEYFVRRLLK